MAIVIEEEKERSGGWFGFGMIFVILVILGVAIYYLFFVKPELIGDFTGMKLQSIDELAQLNFNPQDTVSGDFFKQSRQLVQPPSPGPTGNSSPFGVF